MIDLSRRRLLKAGLAGGALLAIAGGAAWFARRAMDRGSPRALDRDAAAIVRAIVPAMLAGALPGNGPSLAAAVDETVAGVASPWNEASADEVDAFLRAWQSSGWALKRTAYDALHQLVIAAWYANPRSWPAIGYPGPPSLSF